MRQAVVHVCKRTLGLAAVSLALAGCDNSAPGGSGAAARLPAQAMDVIITSPVPDNASGAPTTAIAATVYIPERDAGSPYPLILHSHGWGGDRVTEADTRGSFDSSRFYSVAIDSQVGRFWQEGYAVISFDERGFVDSGGAIRVMDPEFETRDAIAVLDWAEANLDLARDATGDPLVGSIGGSYGGGYQLLLAALDPRLDAITPSVTWNHLPQALATHGVVKKLWDFGLCFAAQTAGTRTFSEDLNTACQQAGYDVSRRFVEELDPAIIAFLGGHGMRAIEQRHDDPADAFRMRRVDALLIQGQRDLLFPLNEAAANARFLSRFGGDVRVLTHQHGHYIGPPLDSQPPLGTMNCGAVDSIEALHQWFDEKLRGKRGAAAGIPRVCISLDDAHAAHFDSVPVADGSFTVTVPDMQITGAQNNYGGQAPAFVPLADPIADAGLVLAGIPLATLEVVPTVPGTRAAAFVGIGVQSPGDAAPRLIDDQTTAIPDGSDGELELAGVGERLAPGDVVGVLIYGDVEAYNNAAKSAWLANAFTVRGQVKLPILAAPVDQAVP